MVYSKNKQQIASPIDQSQEQEGRRIINHMSCVNMKNMNISMSIDIDMGTLVRCKQGLN